MSDYEDSFEGTDSTSSSHSSQTKTNSNSSNINSNSNSSQTRPGKLIPHLITPAPIPVPVREGNEEASNKVIKPLFETSSLHSSYNNNNNNNNNSIAALPIQQKTSTSASISAPNRGSQLVDSIISDNAGNMRLSDTIDSHIELKLPGINAPNKNEFNALSSYVAFRGSSQGSMRVGSITTDSATKPAQSESDHHIKEDNNNNNNNNNISTPTIEVSNTNKSNNIISSNILNTIERDEVHSRAESSVFSTLSQHLNNIEPHKSNKQLEKVTNTITSGLITEVASPSVQPNNNENKMNDNKIPNNSNNNNTTINPSSNIFTLPNESLEISQPPPPITFTLPAVESVRPTTLLLSQSQAESEVQNILISKTAKLPNVESVLASVPPPLPSRQTQQNSKIIELRETSEAVERLVRAFALLRGHASPLPHNNNIPDLLRDARVSFSTKNTEKLSNMRLQHGIGDEATVQIHSKIDKETFKRFGEGSKTIQNNSIFKNKIENDENVKHSIRMNESAVEDAIMCLVMELMQEDTKHLFNENNIRKAIQPSFEVVGIDNFRAPPFSSSSNSNYSKRKTNKKLNDKITPLSVFDDAMRAFAPGDEEASESLYHSVLQALQKYVNSHIITSPSDYSKKGFSSSNNNNNNIPSASPHFAWVLQLDLLSVCMQALENCFNNKNIGEIKSGINVLVQYDGPREAESLARNAIHCLPFEVIDAKKYIRPIFRLEYWVTRDKLNIIIEALVTSIREGIVSRSDAYRTFNNNNNNNNSILDDAIGLDPSILLPTRVPLFSLLSIDKTSEASLYYDKDNNLENENLKRVVSKNRKRDLRWRQSKKNINSDYDDDNNSDSDMRGAYFHLDSATLESLAHTVSTVSTELLENNNNNNNNKSNIINLSYNDKYRDATEAVTEAVNELLSDANIRAAVRRRASAKMLELAQRREINNNISRETKEQKIIEAAEAEAERVVQRILQEIKVEEARSV